jgi:hypothetical protein
MKKYQLKTIFVSLLILAIVLVLILINFPLKQNEDDFITGGDRDSHGCIPSAGYTWCESKKECIRIWEQTCESLFLECSNYTFERCPQECVVCPPCKECSSISCNSEDFCASIGFDRDWYLSTQKKACTQEQKKAEICTQDYSPTCGWFNKSIQCIKYPCADTFSNPCFACADARVDYYTSGECPIN